MVRRSAPRRPEDNAAMMKAKPTMMAASARQRRAAHNGPLTPETRQNFTFGGLSDPGDAVKFSIGLASG
jgi:hypothetical protein